MEDKTCQKPPPARGGRAVKKALLWLAYVFLAALALALLLPLLLLLCFPVKYRALARVDGGAEASIRVSYLFGLARFAFTVRDGKAAAGAWLLWHNFVKGGKGPAKAPDPEEDGGPRAEGAGGGNRPLFFRVLQGFQKKAKSPPAPENAQKPPDDGLGDGAKQGLTYGDIKLIISGTGKLAKKLFRAVKPKRLDVEGEFGFADPSETAICYGAYEALANMLGIRKQVRLFPIFNNEATVWRVKASAFGRINLYRLIAPLAGILLDTRMRALILKGDNK